MSRENNDMAYIAEVTHVFPIPDADAIEKLVINAGWPVVAKKGEFVVGDKVIYFELDSWVPTKIAPFLSKGKEPREFNGVKGERLKSIKLRGQKSQGLVLHIGAIDRAWTNEEKELGAKVGEVLGVQKWEIVDGFNAGQPRGNFPSFMQKTDQERIQNCIREVLRDHLDTVFEVDLKLDGSSTQTCLRSDGDFVVCSRNLQLKVDDSGSTFVKTVKKVFGENCEKLNRPNTTDLAFQMELVGPAIQKNREALTDHELFVFDIFDTRTGEHLSPDARHAICMALDLRETPVVARGTLRELGLTDIDKFLAFAQGPSLNNKIREGLVFKSIDGKFSFKVINDDYLLEKGN